MATWRSLTGMIELEITGADLWGSIQRINEAGIPVFDAVSRDEMTGTFLVYRRDTPIISQICEKRGDTVRICRRKGLYWKLCSILHRPCLVGGLCLLILLTLFLPTRVLFVQVSGNQRIPDNRILEAAEAAGIRFWASRRAVRSEQVKNKLLYQVPELKWAGVNTSGCVATVSVRESDPVLPQEQNPEEICSIAAERDGVILSATAEQGSLLCVPGQAVRKGEILISGYVDCGICIRATHARGEIYAETVRHQTVVMPDTYLKRTGQKKTKVCYSLLVGKKRINLWKYSGIWDRTCGRIYTEQYVVLPGGFRLPFGLGRDVISWEQTCRETIRQDQALPLLCKAGEDYLLNHTVAGKILQQSASDESCDGLCRLSARYSLTEMIGRKQREQIGEEHGTTG